MSLGPSAQVDLSEVCPMVLVHRLTYQRYIPWSYWTGGLQSEVCLLVLVHRWTLIRGMSLSPSTQVDPNQRYVS